MAEEAWNFNSRRRKLLIGLLGLGLAAAAVMLLVWAVQWANGPDRLVRSGIVAYCALATIGYLVPYFYVLLTPQDFVKAEEAAAIASHLPPDEKTRLGNLMMDERPYYRYIRQRIRLLYASHYYCILVSVATPVLIAAGTAHTERELMAELLAMMSVHLAIVLGLHKAFKVEVALGQALRTESEFYRSIQELIHAIKPDFEAFIKKTNAIRAKAYGAEPTVIGSTNNPDNG